MKKILLGNEAIVRAALASGVSYVTGYPGCPSAEIGDEFGKIAKENGVYAEYATNEKTALESAIGASFSGLKVLVNMKSFGINVCSDVLLPLAYTGTKGGMVIVVADDPSCWSSAQSEQNSRMYAYLGHIPMLEPADPQECYDFTKIGFEISEKFNMPVILRTVTRCAHQRAVVEVDEPHSVETPRGDFVKNPHQYSTMPPRTLEMKKELLEKIKKIQAYAEKSKINKIVGLPKSYNLKVGIIASGVAGLHVMEALEELKLDLPVLQLGSFYPLPKEKIIKFIKPLKKVLVVEELEGYVEKEIAVLAKDANAKMEIFGKNVLPIIGELSAEKVCGALSKVVGMKFAEFKTKNLNLPKRTARLCEGCPYWYILPTIKRIAPEGTIFGGDIGCNMIGALPPHSMYDYLFCMGASIGVAHGILKAEGPERSRKVISFMGDGTFFHSGIAGMVNAVYNKSNPLMIVMDNRITAMTGHQPNPGMGKNLMGEEAPELSIEEIAKACGVKNIKVLDPINQKELEDVVKEFLEKEEISLIVCKKICALLLKKQTAEKHDQ
ncbi:MAG: thiamine pyrophosphate-dependent enzyme [Candidatus Staskawiczbacteria bacterium]|nr:thiamine pyrophosphate-dependent enzyme [Candidatus Staskawiczbacteria bacterium]